MQTKKDAEIVGWIGRIGAAGAEHVMAGGPREERHISHRGPADPHEVEFHCFSEVSLNRTLARTYLGYPPNPLR